MIQKCITENAQCVSSQWPLVFIVASIGTEKGGVVPCARPYSTSQKLEHRKIRIRVLWSRVVSSNMQHHGWSIATCHYSCKLSTCSHDLMSLLCPTTRTIWQSNIISPRSGVRIFQKMHLFKPGWKRISMSHTFLVLNSIVNNEDGHAIHRLNSRSPGCNWPLQLHALYCIVF